MSIRSLTKPKFYKWVEEELIRGRYVLCYSENGEKWYHATSLLSAIGVPNNKKVWVYRALKTRKWSKRVQVSEDDEFTFVQPKHLCALRWVQKIANTYGISLAKNKITIKSKI